MWLTCALVSQLGLATTVSLLTLCFLAWWRSCAHLLSSCVQPTSLLLRCCRTLPAVKCYLLRASKQASTILRAVWTISNHASNGIRALQCALSLS